MLKLFRQHSATSARIGVSFGPKGLAMAAIGRSPQGQPRLEHCAYVPTGAGASAGLDQFLRDRGLGRTPLSVVIQPEDYQLVLIETPDVLPSELRAAVRWRLKDAIGFHIDDAVVDVFEIPDQSRRAQARMTYAVATRSAAVQRYVQAASSASRRLDVIDIPELCLRNLCMLTTANASGVALLAAGPRSGHLVLVRNGVLYLTRHIEWATGGDVVEFTGEQSIDAGALALEVQRSLDYYESHYDQTPIGDLVVAPLAPSTADLATRLATEIGLRVSAIDLGALLQCREPLGADLQHHCLFAIGAALRLESRVL